MRWTIEIPGFRPTPLNQLLRMHWTKRKRVLRGESAIICQAAREAVPLASGKRRVTITLSYARGQTRCDPDAAWKGLLDALVAANALVDDGPDWCVPGDVLYAVGPRGTRIDLEDVPGLDAGG